MSHIDLRCTRCGTGHAADMDTLACRACRSPLEVTYLGDAATGATDDGPGGLAVPLPLHEPAAMVSLGEGDTPCVEMPGLARALGLQRLFGKLEFLNPTGSFKDRGTAVMVSVAAEHGVDELVEDSSGNAGASVAAYAVRAGIMAHIFVPADAPAAKLRQIEAYGARLHRVPGTRQDTARAAVDYQTGHGIVYASHAWSPYFAEGTKTFAYELARWFGDRLPAHIVFPVGNGSLFTGAWLGFEELRNVGRLGRMPRLHTVQARAVAPIVAAHRAERWDASSAGRTVAGGIAVAAPPRIDQVLRGIETTGGAAVAVEDDAILEWQRRLATTEGIYAEATSAAALAGVQALMESSVIAAGDTVLVPITGSGLKDSFP